MERSPGPAPPGSEPRAAEGSPGSRARCGRRARSRVAAAGLMLLEPRSLGGGSALGAEGGKGGRSWQRAGEAGRPWQREGNLFQVTPKYYFPRPLTVNLCTGSPLKVY